MGILCHEPTIEHITWFGEASKFVSSITLAIMDAATNTLITLDKDWACELKFYIEVAQ